MWIDNLRINDKMVPQYQRIKEQKEPIFIWSCGALATRAYRYCEKYGIKVEGFFVDMKPSLKSFLGLRVYTIEEILESVKKFNVIIGHAHYFDGIQKLNSLPNVQEIYCLSSLSYNITTPIPVFFLQENRMELNDLYEELQDGWSRNCLRSYLESRINDVSEYMMPYFNIQTGYFINDVFSLQENEVFLDVGACVGSAIWSFINAVHEKYKYIIAIEPEEENFLELKKNIEQKDIKNILIRQVCAFNKDEKVRFEGNMEIGGIKKNASNYKLVPALRIDSICKEVDASVAGGVTVIKINFPNCISEVLEGARELLSTRKPKLIIRVGFDENVLLEAYRAIKRANADYKIYFRYTVGIPQGLTFFAI